MQFWHPPLHGTHARTIIVPVFGTPGWLPTFSQVCPAGHVVHPAQVPF
ncbi:MAG TPA: hypothetical protein VMI75_16685 [Polyangiaceae bacterium]|nr:hypothetical protein [Polyangiaceae bacterium]